MSGTTLPSLWFVLLLSRWFELLFWLLLLVLWLVLVLLWLWFWTVPPSPSFSFSLAVSSVVLGWCGLELGSEMMLWLCCWIPWEWSCQDWPRVELMWEGRKRRAGTGGCNRAAFLVTATDKNITPQRENSKTNHDCWLVPEMGEWEGRAKLWGRWGWVWQVKKQVLVCSSKQDSNVLDLE